MLPRPRCCLNTHATQEVLRTLGAACSDPDRVSQLVTHLQPHRVPAVYIELLGVCAVPVVLLGGLIIALRAHTGGDGRGCATATRCSQAAGGDL
jgi:hypothetical protein